MSHLPERQTQFQISLELLNFWLQLPEGVKVVDVLPGDPGRNFWTVVTGEGLPEDVPTVTMPVLSRVEDEDTVTWDWQPLSTDE